VPGQSESRLAEYPSNDLDTMKSYGLAFAAAAATGDPILAFVATSLPAAGRATRSPNN
jgi:hypothetical protein